MNRISLVYFVLIFSFFVLNCKKDNSELQKKEAIALTEKFQKELQEILAASIKEAGVENSIEKCNLKSPELESAYSTKEKWQIKRISDKYRNPNHKPNELELAVLEKWKADLKAGKQISPEVSNVNGILKVLKPIIIKKELCLQCHGSNSEISEKTFQAIQKSYPNDNAINYKMEELRGAFSLTLKTE